MEKSHVGMAQCYFCGEDSTILLDRRLRNTLTMKTGVINMEPCSECKSYMEVGIIVMSIADDTTAEVMKGPIPNPYRTGGWAVVTRHFVERVFADGRERDFALSHNFMFITDAAWSKLELPRS